MRNLQFEEAVSRILKKDHRYHKDAYLFVRDALDHTVKKFHTEELEEYRHVTGVELLEGLRDYAITELGPMSLPVLESWGVRSGSDVGRMVYHLIDEQAFGRSKGDDPSDFEGWITFEEAFQQPFRPTRKVLVSQLQEDSTEVSEPVDSHGRGTKPATPKDA